MESFVDRRILAVTEMRKAHTGRAHRQGLKSAPQSLQAAMRKPNDHDEEIASSRLHVTYALWRVPIACSRGGGAAKSSAKASADFLCNQRWSRQRGRSRRIGRSR